MNKVTTSIEKRGWGLLGMVWITVMLAQTVSFSYGMVLPDIMSDLQFGYDTAGNMAGISQLIAGLLTIPIVALATKLDPRYSIMGMIFLGGSGLLLFGLAQNTFTMLTSMILFKSIMVSILGAVVVVKVKWVPQTRLTEINGIENFLQPIGQTLGTMAIVYILAFFGGWRMTAIVLGSLVLVLAILWPIFYRDKKEMTSNTNVASQSTVAKNPILQAMKLKTVWLLAFAWPTTTLIWVAAFTFWPSHATDTLGLTIGQTGFILGLIPIFSAIASLTSPYLAKSIGYDKPLIWIWGFILPVSYFILLQTSNLVILAIAAAICGYGAYAFVPLAYTILYRIPGLHSKTVAASTSIVLTAITLGAALGSIIVGQLSEIMTLYSAMAICCLAPFIFGILTLFLPEYGRKYMEKNQAIDEENSIKHSS